MLYFTKIVQHLQFKVIEKYAELSEKIAVATSISRFVNKSDTVFFK